MGNGTDALDAAGNSGNNEAGGDTVISRKRGLSPIFPDFLL